MHPLLSALRISIQTFSPNSGNAGDRPRQIEVSNNPKHQAYRGYYFDLSEIAERQDSSVLVNAQRQQIDPSRP